MTWARSGHGLDAAGEGLGAANGTVVPVPTSGVVQAIEEGEGSISTVAHVHGGEGNRDAKVRGGRHGDIARC